MKDTETLLEIIEVLSANDVSNENAPAVCNRILDILYERPVGPETRLATDVQVATFVSEFDDGSVFRSNCLVNVKARKVIAVTPVGYCSDDACCTYQHIVLSDGATYPVNEPDMDRIYETGFDMA